MVRDGALDSSSLAAAVADEHARGLRPRCLAVGSVRLEAVALRCLELAPGALGDLMVVTPNVVLDRKLGERSWELRA